MKKAFFLFCLLWLALVASTANAASPEYRPCPRPWKCELRKEAIPMWSDWTGKQGSIEVALRSGYLPENSRVPFRGNVIYYQGLGDSMLNHAPLFSQLSALGFRVIAFDYMGQGGSAGSMNDTRIFQIFLLGQTFWKRYARDLASFPKKTIIGWSTGGLAAYTEAVLRPRQVDNVVLIAPGISPKLVVGEQRPLQFEFNKITLASLTSANYNFVPNPHVDPIKPGSPLEVFDFSWDLINTAKVIREETMPHGIKGFVLLGTKDSYVDTKKTIAVLKKTVPSLGNDFMLRVYPGARHEIDNETQSIGGPARADILNFIDRNS